MSRACPNCGTSAAPEARFCRLCGAPLKAAITKGTPVSPRAKTIPLSDEGRTTRSLSGTEGGTGSPDTHKVGRAEMESILRRPSQPIASEQGTQDSADVSESSSYAAPATSALPAIIDAQAATESQLAATRAAGAGETEAQPKEPSAVDAAAAQKRAQPSRGEKKRGPSARRIWQVVALAFLFVAVGAGVLAIYYSRQASTRDSNNPAQPISISDQQRLVEEKLKEAEGLLAQGKYTDAIARLRYIIKLDASNHKAHRMLAEALESTGNVNEAIDEYAMAVRLEPGDEETQVRYADALRRVGRTDEARDIYQKLSTSNREEVARNAKEQLDALPPASGSGIEPSRENRVSQPTRTEEGASNVNASAPAPPPQPAASSAARPGNSTNDPVASYNTAMKIIEGKDIKKMKRAELIRAYELFQYAQRGPNGTDASRHLRELDKVLFEGGKRRQ